MTQDRNEEGQRERKTEGENGRRKEGNLKRKKGAVCQLQYSTIYVAVPVGRFVLDSSKSSSLCSGYKRFVAMLTV